jgi:hypothetical protein
MTMSKITTGTDCTCWRCGGEGRIKQFAHVAKGVCFACEGSGRLPHGRNVSSKGIHTFVASNDVVWQFEPIHHGKDSHYTAQPGQSVDTVLFQAFALGANKRTGTTIIRARVMPEVARKVWKDALAGRAPESFTDVELEIEHDCQIGRNGRGVDIL